MITVKISGQAWGTLWDKQGNARANKYATINTTVYSDPAGTIPLDMNLFRTDTNGRLPGYVAEGDWTLTVDGQVYPAPAVSGTIGGRVDANTTLLLSVESSGPLPDTTDAALVDSVSIAVPSRKLRRIPIADKLVYDVREFFAGAAQPADMLGYIHDGLAKTAVAGGWLQIPDSEEPWMLSEGICPPPNSRMMGPAGMAFFNERSSGTHGAGGGSWPVLPNAMGEAVLRLANGVNGPILYNDFDNSQGKRGPARGNGAYVQWFAAVGLVLDHNGQNQAGDLRAVDIRDAFSVNFSRCRLVAARGRGWSITNSNDVNGPGAMLTGVQEAVANGVGDLSSGSGTISNATGTWQKGDLIAGAGIPSGAYVTSVVGSTITFTTSTGGTASITAPASPLSRLSLITTDALVLEDSTTDSMWEGISMHAARNGVVLDSCYGCTISGLAGYSIGGHNLWIRDTLGASPNWPGGCFDNRVDLRVEQATKHNVRIDADCNDNRVDVAAFAPGMFGTSVDADAVWANVFCDGKRNVVRGVGSKGPGIASGIGAVVAWGPNAVANNARGMSGGSDLPAGTRLYRIGAGTNATPEPPPFFISAKDFEAAGGSTPAMVYVNGTLHRALAFADGATESAVAYCTMPYGCNSATFYVVLVSIGSIAGDARIQIGYADVAITGGNTLGADETGQLSTVAFAANIQTRVARFGPGFSAFAPAIAPGDPVAIRIQRIGADPADTLAGALGLVGVRIEPLILA